MQLVDLKSERIVLGSILSDSKALDAVLLLIGEENFTLPQHRLIFRAFKSLDNNQMPINLRSLALELENGGANENSVTAWISEIAYEGFPEAITDYAKNLKNASNARKLFDLIEKSKKNIEAGEDQEKVINSISTVLESFNDVQDDFETDLHDEVLKAIERVKNRASGSLQDFGVPTGIEELDKIIRLQNGELIIIGARPGGGKSVLLNQIRLNSILSGGLKTGFISLEMSSDQMTDRTVANISGVPLNSIQGKSPITDEDLQIIGLKPRLFKPKENPVCYRPDMTIQTIRQISRRWKRQAGIEILFIDYSQLIEAPKGGRYSNRVEVVSEISRGLKLMAKELQIPVVTASQLNRASEDSDKPSLRHLRESGSIEQDADIVLLLHESPEPNGTTKNICIIAKNRNGRCGEVPISFQKSVQKMA